MRPPATDLKEVQRQLLASPQQCLSYTLQFHSLKVAGLRSASNQWGDLRLEKSEPLGPSFSLCKMGGSMETKGMGEPVLSFWGSGALIHRGPCG